jgi:hypothetical protein
MTELNISADDYNFVTMAYYVCVECQLSRISLMT